MPDKQSREFLSCQSETPIPIKLPSAPLTPYLSLITQLAAFCQLARNDSHRRESAFSNHKLKHSHLHVLDWIKSVKCLREDHT